MTKKITQEERLDLTDKQVREEKFVFLKMVENNLSMVLKEEEKDSKKVVIEKESCNCFTCRHKDEPRVVAGYLQGYIEASDWFINWAEKNKIKMGSIADNDLGGIYAQMKCNRDESGCLLEEFPDLEKPIENTEAEIQRLKEQLDREIKINRKMKEALKKYAECEPLEIKKEYFNNEPTHINKTMADIGALAKQVLKEIDNKE